MIFVDIHAMTKDKEYYKEHPVEYLEEVCSVKLYNYQKEMIEFVMKYYGKRVFIILPYRCGKRYTLELCNKIIKDLF